jgi:hypothetical protein
VSDEHPDEADRPGTGRDRVSGWGKISEMNTQITEPWPNVCAAMNTSRPATNTAEVVL